MNSKCWSVALALTTAMSAVADIHNWKSQPENNWDWTNPNNFEEGKAPSAGDMINIRNGLNVHVKADDAASWAIATDASTILHPSKVGSYVVYDVGEGLDVTNFGSTANRRKSLCAAATRPNTAGRLGAPRCRAGTPPLPSRMRQGALQVISL